jgi:WD40 repeat protein
MMAKEPADRPQSMDEVIAALQSLGHDDTPVDETEIPQRQTLRPWIFVSIVAVVLTATLVGVFVARRPGPAIEVVEARPPAPPPPPVVAKVEKPTPPEPPPKLEIKPAPIATHLPSSQEPIGLIAEFKVHEGRVDSVAVDRSGRYAASGGYDDTVRLWDMQERREIDKETHVGPVFSVAFTNEGNVLSAGNGGRARLRDMKVHREIVSFPASNKRINAVACSPDDPDLGATAGIDNKVRIWRLSKGQEWMAPFQHDDNVTALAFLGRGRSLLSGSTDRSVRLWDLDLKAQKIRLDVGYPVLCLAPSPDGNRVLVGGHNRILALWELGKPGSIQLEGHNSDVMSCAFLSETLAVSGDNSGDSNDGTLILWDLQKPGGEIKWKSDLLKNAGHRGIAVLSDHRHILTADNDGFVRLWNLPVGTAEQGR